MTRARYTALALAMLGCGDDTGTDGALPARCAASSTREMSAVVTRLAFARQAMPGVTEGFDLDGRDNGAMGDGDSCRRRDFVDPAGRRGIDNQISIFAPALDAATAGAFEPLVNAAINSRARPKNKMKSRSPMLFGNSFVRLLMRIRPLSYACYI